MNPNQLGPQDPDQPDDGQDDDEEEFYPHDDDDGDYMGDRIMFADPGGRSALRAETPNNPRDRPCPTCNVPNRLTPADVALGYQCDTCADRAEGIYVGGDY
jgi:hypothetical protein